MNIKEINSKKLFKEYEIQIPYDEVEKLINEKITEIIPTVSLPGFRKGKAPLNIVKKKYEQNVISEVMEKILKEKTKNLLDKKKLKAFRQPKVEIKKYEKHKPIDINIKVDLEPEIKIFPFEKIEITKRTIILDKKTIEENYKNFLNSQKHYHKVDDGRFVKLTDKIIANISTKDKSVPDFLKIQENLSIITDSDYQVLPDISSKLIAKKVKVGDKINLTFDLKKVLKEKNKKEVEFLIEIISLEHVHQFSVTKDFLEKNNLKDENELRENLNKNLNNQYDEHLKQIERKELMDILDEKNSFEIPEGIYDEEFKNIWHRLEHAKKNGKLDEDDKSLNEKQLKERYKKIALRRVKLAILMEHIAKDQKIIVSEKELTDGMLRYASQYPGQEKQIFDYFKTNPSSIETIRGPIFEQKIIDYIISKSKMQNKKIDVKEFQKIQEKTFNSAKEKK